MEFMSDSDQHRFHLQPYYKLSDQKKEKMPQRNILLAIRCDCSVILPAHFFTSSFISKGKVNLFVGDKKIKGSMCLSMHQQPYCYLS